MRNEGEHMTTRDRLDGLVVIDKPRGLTSRAVVDRVKHVLPRGVRLGHAGTLDPLATGVLVICVGVATRFIEYVQRMEKTYRTKIRLGARSSTDDAEGEIQTALVNEAPEIAQVSESLKKFIGDIEQVPPAFSAARVGGRRAYKLARAGQAVSLAPRRVRIDRIDVIVFDYPVLELEVRCGKGTYIRSLVRDLGERLGCGALVQELRRTATGPFKEQNAVDLDAITAASLRLLPVAAAVAGLPRLVVSTADAGRLRHGQAILLTALSDDGLRAESGEVAVYDTADALVGVAQLDAEQRLLRPAKIVASP